LFRRIVKILSRSILIILLLLLTVWVLIQLTPVQNWLVDVASKRLSKNLKTEVSVKNVDFSLFNKMNLEGVLVKDLQKDTLAYAGRVTVSITDWFFLKDKAEIQFLGIENTNVYMHRKDSIWNYNFLVDYFSSPSSGSNKKGIEFSLKKTILKNIHFLRQDEWRGTNEEAKLGYLLLDFNKMDLSNKVIDVKELIVDNPYFSISNYKGLRPPRPSTPDVHASNDSVEHWNDGWIVKAATVQIKNGEFKNDMATKHAPYTHFDGAHIRFYSINGDLKNLELKGDTLQANITLNTKERSGFIVNNLSATMLFHPTGMEFKDMLIETPKSTLRNYFAMRYSHFNHDMASFITHVRLDGNFVNSKLHSDDIAFFAPELKTWNEVITINGAARGTVDHLKGRDIKITAGASTLFEGDFTMDGLPDINTTFLDVKAKRFNTTYVDALRIYPDLKKISKPALNQISYIKFNGSFTGFLKDFVTYGTIETNLGTIVSDINLKLPPGQEPIYSGKLKTQGFQLGRFLNEKTIGNISMDGSLKGRSFDIKKLFAEVDGNIRNVELYGYNYHNITAKGIVERRKFDGALAINDSNLIVNVTGLVDFGKDTPVYRINGMVFKSNLKKLGITRNDISFKGDIDFNFRVKQIEDFMGTALIQNAELMSNGKRLSFDSLYISNQFISATQKEFILRSNEIDAKLNGNFNLVYLPDVTLAFLHNYFPAYIKKPSRKIAIQDFAFDITTKNISEFIELLNAPVKGFDYSTIKGGINIQDNKLNLETNVPSFTYKNILFDNVNISGDGNFSNLSLNGNISSIRLNDSLSLPNTSFVINAANDTGSVSIKTSATQTLKDADLKARFKATTEGFTITFQPSSVVLDEKRWNIEDESDVFIGKGKLLSNGLKFSSGNEEIKLFTQPSETGNGNDLIVEMQKVEIGNIIPYFLKDPRIEGSITGRIDVMNPLGKPNIDAELTADKFRFNNDSLGKVTIKTNYSNDNGLINYLIESANPGHEFTINGNTNIKDPKNIVTDNILKIENEQLTLLNKYLGVIMSDIKGTGNGTLRVKGKGEAPEIIGNVTINNASFILDYTKVRYWFEDGTVIKFKEGEIDFGSIKLRDTLKRTATFSGKMNHSFFRKMNYDMLFTADDVKKGIQVLNTNKRDNSLFYGNVIAYARGSIKGPENKIKLQFGGQPTDSSSLYLATSDSRVTGTADFIVFRKYGKEMKPEINLKDASSLDVELDIVANPYAKVYLILDEITKDIIEGQGNGVINLKVGTNEKTTMSGNFEITKGRYNFNWQDLFKRPFEINSGSVTWNGDPYNARIDIDARYLVEKISLLPELVAGTNCGNELTNIYVVANLGNTITNPSIKFNFELPQGHPCKNNPVTEAGFTRLRANEDELNRQVFSLLFLNSFNSSGTIVQSSFLTTPVSTLSEFLAQRLNIALDVALKNIPGIKALKLDPYVTFNPGLITGLQAQGLGFQGTGSFGVTRNLLNGKLVLKAGGNVFVGNTQQASLVNSNNQLTPDVEIGWLITPDGKLQLKGFYRTIFDVQRRSNRSGISFSYVKDFDKF
jgi:TamB, inner membrane protein subunit of TAM complex